VSRALRVAAVLWVAAAGCRTTLPPAIPLDVADPRPAAFLAALAARAGELEALSGMVKLAVDGPGGSLRSKQVLVAARPARLRIEIQGFLSQTVALLATDGTHYDLFQVRERSLESDRVRPGLLWEVAAIDLEPDEAVRVLLGAPDLRGLRPTGAQLLGDGAVAVALADAAGRPRRVLEFLPDGALRRISARDADGAVAWDARYGDRRSLGDTSFAHAIELEFPASGVRARLSLSRVVLNPPLSPTLFRLNDLPGVSYNEGAGGRG
jgi:hypothetical protein